MRMMRIGENISALIANRQLENTSAAISRALQRLSTGKRVLSPRDDIASFSSVQGLTAQTRGLRQANRNINLAQGLLSTAEAAVSTQLDILQQIRALAVEGSSGALSSSERESINASLQSLMEEFSRITQETEFNGIHLLDGSSENIRLLTGSSASDFLEFDLPNLGAGGLFRKNTANLNYQDQTSSAGLASHDKNSSMELIDVDADGNLDLVSLEANSDLMRVQLGRGDGTFGTETSFGVAVGAIDFDIGDINSDGLADIVTADAASNTVSIYYGVGDGSFQEAITLDSYGFSQYIKLGDLDGDGKLDIVTSVSAADDYVVSFLNDGIGSFHAGVSSDIDDKSAFRDLLLEDYDNDGKADISIVGAGNFNNGGLYTYSGDGLGGFSAKSSVAFTSIGGSFESIDFDNDGDLDFVAFDKHSLASTAVVYLLENDGVGNYSTLGTFQVSSTTVSSDLRVSDFNNDGISDFVYTNGTSNSLDFYLGDGAGGFTLGHTLASVATPVYLALGDVNGDGVEDIIADSSTGPRQLFTAIPKSVAALGDIHVRDVETASKLIDIVDEVSDRLLEARSDISIKLHQLEIRSDFNLLQSENLAEARSLIEDADLALETADLVRLQILQQAQIAVLSQANVNMRVVLGLLDNLNN